MVIAFDAVLATASRFTQMLYKKYTLEKNVCPPKYIQTLKKLAFTSRSFQMVLVRGECKWRA